MGILNDGCLADIENRKLGNLKEKTLSYRFAIAHAPGKKHVGPDAASRYPVGQPDKLEIPDESKETDFSVRSISHTMWDNLTTIEMLQDEIDMFSVASMKNALGTLSETHRFSCCVCMDIQNTSVNYISWEQIRSATAEV